MYHYNLTHNKNQYLYSYDPHHLSQYNINTAVEDRLVFKIRSVGMLLWGLSVSSSDHREYYPGYDIKYAKGFI